MGSGSWPVAGVGPVASTGLITRGRPVACAGPVARARSGRWVIVRPCRVVVVERVGLVMGTATVVLAGVWVLRVGSCRLVERAPLIIAAARFVSSAPVGVIGRWAPHVDAGADGIAVADDEAPRPIVPSERAIEIRGHLIALVLEGREHILQVGVAPLPIDAVESATAVDAVEIVEIDFIHRLILFEAQSEFVGHLIAEEEGFGACLRVWERCGGDGYRHRHGQSQKFFHLFVI